MYSGYKRPLFWLGHGIRLAGAVDLIEPLLERYPIPFITSWQGKDMVRHDHPRFYGHAGVYGHRAANTIVQNADLIIAVGTRLSLMQTGFDLLRFAESAEIRVVDVDSAEATKNPRYIHIGADAKQWIEDALTYPPEDCPAKWLIECMGIQDAMPWLEAQHAHGKFINPYRFMWDLNQWLKPDQIIVTDMGTALLTAYPMLRLNGKQRLITSTGLGEMGFGLPAAIGAAMASGKEVLCLNCDGGLMFNLQELATIQHHKLPIKLIVFCNDGYAMIKRSQEGLGLAHTASGAADLSFPDWERLAEAFNMHHYRIDTPHQIDAVKDALDIPHACFIEVRIDPAQKFTPKAQYGKTLEDMV